MVTNIWIDWLEETTLTTIAETEFDLWNIFYPGVSFCSNNKVDSDSWAVFEALQRAKFDEVGIKSNLRFINLGKYLMIGSFSDVLKRTRRV